jgi:hypothetical protein
MQFVAKTELKNWRNFECICTKGSSNVKCPLRKILHMIRKKVSFDTFISFVKQTGSIARLPPNHQTRAGYLKYISKCRSGRFYRRMDPEEDENVQEHPETYQDSDDEATVLTDNESDTATDEYDFNEFVSTISTNIICIPIQSESALIMPPPPRRSAIHMQRRRLEREIRRTRCMFYY